MTKPSAPADSALAKLLLEIKQIDLGEVKIPYQGPKCRHFVAFGEPDDFTKKLFAHKWRIAAQGLSDLQAANDLAVEEAAKIDMPRGTEAQLQQARDKAANKVIDEAIPELNQLYHMGVALGALIHVEMLRQFPASGDPRINRFLVDEDWTVGWIDHDSAKMAAETVRDIFGASRDDAPEELSGLRSELEELLHKVDPLHHGMHGPHRVFMASGGGVLDDLLSAMAQGRPPRRGGGH